MPGSACAHELGRSRCARTLAAVLVVALWTLPSLGQENPVDALIKKVLPAPLNGEVLPTPQAPPERQLVPLSPPIKDQNIQVEEADGLISLSVRNASLRQVVALVAETQKLNLVFASPEDIAVTATFDKVPWQQALDSLLSATGHTWTDNGGIIFVTSNMVAAAVAPQAGGRQVHVFELDFAAATDIDQTVQGLLSPAGKSWILESSTDDNRRTREAVAVVDYPANLAQIADYICQADQPPRQVLIEAHILKVELDDQCRNGVDFDQLTASFSGNQVRFLTAGFAGSPQLTSASFLEVDGAALDSMIEVLQTTLDAKTLASPKVLAVSGQMSKLQIGEKIGYRETTTTQTSSLESVKFLDVGVVLTVTPRITRDGRVLMRVKPEVSTGQLNPVTDLPNSETTHVETDILLEDGHGMVIGGLIQEEDRNSQNKIPWLGDIPYAGVLFQRRTVEKTRTEIIVTLMPRVLPYSPMVARRNDFEFMRTDQPLTYGAIHRFPRPYEPQLPDTFDNPVPLCERVHSLPPHARPQIVRLPPVECPSETYPIEYAAGNEPPVDVDMARLPNVYRR